MPKKWLRRFALFGLLAVPWSVESRVERIFVHGTLLDKRLGYLASGEGVFIQAEDLTLAGELYEPSGVSPPHPAILLVHGSTRWGRRMALYPLLADGLARKGYLVLAIDLRSFGGSETPADTHTVDAWDSTKDISAALTYLESLERVDSERLFLVGHSLGGTWAIKASEKDPRIERLAVIGPGKRLKAFSARAREEFRERFWKVRNLEQSIAPDTFQKIHEATFLAAVLDYFKGEGHQPILLIDGELESEPSKRYLDEHYGQMTQPKSFVRLEDTAHYLSVAGLEELHRVPGVGNLVVYDSRTMTDALSAIDAFLSE
jgi:pimeloyl-ACP methyl ester carboxylesterase